MVTAQAKNTDHLQDLIEAKANMILAQEMKIQMEDSVIFLNPYLVMRGAHKLNNQLMTAKLN